MSNIYARLDHLIDRFKHDVRDLIDSAVSEERTVIMERLQSFVSVDSNVPKKLFEGGIIEKGTEFVGDGIGSPAYVMPPPSIMPKVVFTDKSEKTCGHCKRRGEPCVKHGGKSSQYVPKKKREKQAIMLPATTPERKEEPAQLSNRPLIEFVGKKKEEDKPFICGYCGKPCDDRYCSAHCEREDKLFNEMTSNKGKSYAQIMTEKGVKPKKVTFEYKDRH